MIIDWLSEDAKELKQAIGIPSDPEEQVDVTRTGSGTKSNLGPNPKSGSSSRGAASSASAYRSAIRFGTRSNSKSNTD